MVHTYQRGDEYCENNSQYQHQQQHRTMVVQGGVATTIDDDTNHIINLNPATGETIGRVACTTNVDELVEDADSAQKDWSRRSVSDRIQLLRDGLVALSHQSSALVDTIVREMGKPIDEAREEIANAVDKKDNEYLTVLSESLRPIKHGPHNVVVREAHGVVIVLGPWNFPCDELLLLTLPALASGNTVIVKPSELTPISGELTIRALASVLPPHVLQVAQGDGRVGSALVRHPSVNMVAMTGSSATGRKILSIAAPQMKRLVLELGGKDPMVVLDDADLVLAADDAVQFSLSNAGQVCCSYERIFVAESIYDDFIDRVVERAKTYRVGNGMDPNTKVGPLASSVQRDKVAVQVDDALSHGARLVYQSDIPIGTGGYYHPVTVIADVAPTMKLYREETFGPVVTIIRFSGTDQDAIDLANDTEYGLAASVYTKNMDRATRISQGIRAGQVGINCYAPMNMESSVPWVGHKASGYGYHSGREGFNNFSLPKTIVFSDPAATHVDL